MISKGMMCGAIVGLAFAVAASPSVAQAPRCAPARPAGFFKTPLTAAEMKDKQAVVETTAGTFVIQLLPESAPNHVGYFIKTVREGGYARTVFHRAIKYGVIQGGMVNTRTEPVPQKARTYVRTLQPEFNDLPHVKGTLSTARLDDPASASTSFLICMGPAPSPDGKYTAFGGVADGMPVVEELDAVPTDGETPRERVEVVKARVVRSAQ